MLDIKCILKFLDFEYAVLYLYAVLMVALIPFLDCIIILWAVHYTGEYLFIAILAAMSLGGFFFSRTLLKKNLMAIKLDYKSSEYSDYNYSKLPGTLLISFFLIMPGCLSFLTALILSQTRIHYKTGRWISRFLKIDWQEIHEFIIIMD